MIRRRNGISRKFQSRIGFGMSRRGSIALWLHTGAQTAAPRKSTVVRVPYTVGVVGSELRFLLIGTHLPANIKQ